MLMENKDLIITLNELKGTIEDKLHASKIEAIAEAYGNWLDDEKKKVVIGRDTRPSGQIIERLLIKGLQNADCTVISLGICPTPVFFYIKNKLNIKGGIIISDSNRSLNQNKIKLYIDEDFIYRFDFEEINNIFNKSDIKIYDQSQFNKSVQNINPISIYIHDLFEILDFKDIRIQNNLRVIVDLGAGAGKVIIPRLLENLGCEVLVINDDLNKNNNLPRELSPIKNNLDDLRLALWKGNYDVGFAYDLDANKLTVVSDKYECYTEEIVSSLIIDYYISKNIIEDKNLIFFLNLASSLRFEVLAEQNEIEVVKIYTKNQYSKERIEELSSKNNRYIIFSSQGLNGSPIFPHFNKVKDGIFMTAKLVEILVDSGQKLSDLISKLPKFYSYQDKIILSQDNLDEIIINVNKELKNEGESVIKVDNHLRFGHEKEWFVLITPSINSIKILSEARRDSLARLYCETTTELIKIVISKLKKNV